MTALLTQNSKLKSTSLENNAKIYNFGIPAKETCFGADKCKPYCYADKGMYIFAKKAQHARLELSKTDDFCLTMLIDIIEKGLTHVRIHDSGDFYSREYLHKWFKIIESLPHVTFYAYTKSIPIFIGEKLPTNLTLIYSYGGKFDHMINPETDRHAKIFDNAKDLKDAGYIDASSNDLNAINPISNKIGLIIH